MSEPTDARIVWSDLEQVVLAARQRLQAALEESPTTHSLIVRVFDAHADLAHQTVRRTMAEHRFAAAETSLAAIRSGVADATAAMIETAQRDLLAARSELLTALAMEGIARGLVRAAEIRAELVTAQLAGRRTGAA